MIKSGIRRLARFLNATDGSLKRKTMRSGFWVSASASGLGLLSLVRSIILARLLTPEIFGMMAICLVVVRWIQVMTETGFGAALIQRPGEIQEAKDTAYTLMALRGVGLALVVILVSPLVADFYDKDILDSLLKVLAISLIIGGLNNINTFLLQKELNFRPLFYLEQVTALADFVIVVALAYWWRSVWALVVGQVIVAAVSVTLSHLLLPGKVRFRLNMDHARELFGFGKYITGLAVVLFITTELDKLVIGKVLGLELLGVYVVAYTLANLPATHLSKVISRVTFPAYSKVQNDHAALRRAYIKTLRFVGALVIPASVGMAVLADEIIAVIYGKKWELAATVLPVLCIFGGVRALAALNGYVYNAIGKPNIVFYMNAVKLVVIAAIIVPATTAYGILGAAWALTIPTVVQYLVGIAVFTRVIELRLRIALVELYPVVLASTVMAVTVSLLKGLIDVGSVGGFLVAVVAGALSYGLANFKYLRGVIQEVFR
jgi:O-antigen/teichoic acid export membrane protein